MVEPPSFFFGRSVDRYLVTRVEIKKGLLGSIEARRHLKCHLAATLAAWVAKMWKMEHIGAVFSTQHSLFVD